MCSSDLMNVGNPFGAVMGMFLADVGFLIKYAIDKHKEKKRKKNEESADKAE